MPKAKKVDANLVDTAAVLGGQAKQVIDSLAKGLGVAATELWSIFVRQYVVRGANELFTALVLFVSAWFLSDYIQFWALIPAAIGIGFVYGAISYLGNPKYYALNDIVKRIQEFKDKDGKVEIRY
jgi:hypothetical protein